MTFFSLPISHLRQYQFCPRIPWFQEVAAVEPLRPMWVAQGQRFHHRQEFLSRRRKLSRYGLDNAEQLFDQAVRSFEPAMHGRIDLVLLNEHTVHVVEFKLGDGKPTKGQVLQAAAYAMAAQNSYGRKCPGFFVVTGRKAKVHYYELTPLIQSEVTAKVDEINQQLKRVILPDSPAKADVQCTSCEYLHYCNDRD